MTKPADSAAATRATRPIRLADVLAALPNAMVTAADGVDPAQVLLSDVTLDSRAAGPGVLFACRPGVRADGHEYAGDAVAAGAPALLVERVLDVTVPQIVVSSVAHTVGDVAAIVHEHPSRQLRITGITGTNGKTTTSYLLEAALRAAGRSTGLIGTVETRINNTTLEGVRTTPESTDLQRLFADMRAAQVDSVAMEVSSHGLALGRLRGTKFAATVFTNLSLDHLDFHGTLEQYFAAKASLFDQVYSDHAVINVDDAYGGQLATIAAGRGLDVLRVSPSGQHRAALHAQDVELHPHGARFVARLHDMTVPVALRITGEFNVANALCALAAATVLGVPLEQAAAGLAEMSGVPGRMERIEGPQPFTVLVDYAHTPDGVQQVLRAARAVTDGRVLVVVGCGGDRDRNKRGPMGAAAAELADLAYFTSDNPRSEDPAAILDAMVVGARATQGTWIVEPSRYDAIAMALREAQPSDVVVIAGKGHEGTQEFANMVVPFDDRAVAAELLAQLFGTEAL